MSQDEDHDDWEEVWDARVAALTKVLGVEPHEILHAPHPFELGGFADVISFQGKGASMMYVTAELTGKPDASYADYELMICQRRDDEWGPNLVSRLAPYTQESVIYEGDTMDIDSGVPGNSLIKALLFDTYGRFVLFGEQFDLRLCIGITKDELEFKKEHGSKPLLKLLKSRGVYPYTDLSRASIPLE